MKLIEKHTPHKLSENEIYTEFQCIFHSVFCDIPDIDLDNASFYNEHFCYQESELEKKFYEERYLNLAPTTVYSKDVNGYRFENLNKFENDIIDYSLNIVKKMLVVTGRQGWGKTTLIRNVFYHLLPKNPQNPVLPIYVSFNRHINKFNISQKENFENLFYELLSDNISKYTAKSLSKIDDKFWTFLKSKKEYIKYYVQCCRLEDMVKKGILTTSQQLKEICALQDVELKRIETILYSLQFIQQEYKIEPIFIFDDLDPLQYDFVIWLFNETYRLSHIYYFKTILVMRPNTYQQIKLCKTFQAISPVEFPLEIPNCSIFLTESLAKFKNEINASSKNVNIVVENKKITPNDINIFVENYCRVALSYEAKLFLENTSGGDLRNLKKLLRAYLSSGYIKLEKILGLISIDLKEDSLPIWIVYTSIITNNYLSVFPHTKTNEDDFIINVLCNGGEYANTYLIRLHILAYFHRFRRISNLDEFVERYSPLLKEGDTALRNSIKRVLKRFNNARLITNHKHLYIDKKEEVNDIDEFHILPLGHYYLKYLFFKFEYIVYMKDDIDYDENNKYDIKDCIEVREQAERFKEVVKYLHFFYEKEKIFISQIQLAQLDKYIKCFSPAEDKCFLFSLQMVNKMNDYGKRRNFDLYELDRLRKEINEFAEKIFNRTI